MIWVRSILFHICFFCWTLFGFIALLPTFFIPRRAMVECVIWFFSGYIPFEKYVAGISYEVRGRENIPAGPCIYAIKHQSTYETLKLHPLFGDVAIILKRELMMIPFWGWYQAKSGVIPVNRSLGAQAIPNMLESAKRVVQQEGRSIVIFPQGTRVRPFVKAPYKVGVYAIYEATGLPIVPVAINAGIFWPKRALLLRPGRVVFDVLPPIEPGLSREAVKARLEPLLEERSDQLCREAQQA